MKNMIYERKAAYLGDNPPIGSVVFNVKNNTPHLQLEKLISITEEPFKGWLYWSCDGEFIGRSDGWGYPTSGIYMSIFDPTHINAIVKLNGNIVEGEFKSVGPFPGELNPQYMEFRSDSLILSPDHGSGTKLYNVNENEIVNARIEIWIKEEG